MFIDPLFWLFVCVLLLLVNVSYLKLKVINLTVTIGLLIIFIAAMPITANYLVKWHEIPIVNSQIADCFKESKASNIILLAGGVIPANMIETHPLTLLEVKSYRRLLSAYDLYMRNPSAIDKIYIAGGAGHAPYKEANIISAMLLSLGIPNEKLVIENSSISTYQNAKNLLALAPELKSEHNILVTSALHMRRAKYIFSHFNIDSCSYVVDSSYINSHIFIPRLSALYKTSKVFREILAYWVYRLRF